jgi:hypothetical protein
MMVSGWFTVANLGTMIHDLLLSKFNTREVEIKYRGVRPKLACQCTILNSIAFAHANNAITSLLADPAGANKLH